MAGRAAVVARLLEKAAHDPGQRGVAKLLPAIAHEFQGAAAWLGAQSKAGTAAIVTTGFPCCIGFTPPSETDGLLGALVLAHAISHTGATAFVVVDPPHFDVVRVGCEAWASAIQPTGNPSGRVVVKCFDDQSTPHTLASATAYAKEFVSSLEAESGAVLNTVAAVERAGMAHDGNHYTMRGLPMPGVQYVDALFLNAAAQPNVKSIGIGDGGNELGMGKVKDLVKEHINNGDRIACVVPADFTLVSGTSDWGAFALACAMHALRDDAAKWRVPASEQLYPVLKAMVDAGAREGMSKEQRCWVDNLPWEVYSAHIADMGKELEAEQ